MNSLSEDFLPTSGSAASTSVVARTGLEDGQDVEIVALRADDGSDSPVPRRTERNREHITDPADCPDRAEDHCVPPTPGDQQWNKIEHRLFSHMSINWRGRPLTSHEVIVNTIAATTTTTGLKVHAELDTASYPTGIKIPDIQMRELEDNGRLSRHTWHGEWNYSLNPKNARVEN